MLMHWRSSLSGKEYRIFRGKIIAGILKFNLWKGDAYGELNGHMLRFQYKGFWKSKTRIMDIEGVRELGSITYNFWKSTAEIVYDNEYYTWSYSSWWRKRWSVRNTEDAIQFTSTSFWKNEGTIDNENLPAALALTGIFIHCHFMRVTAAAS